MKSYSTEVNSKMYYIPITLTAICITLVRYSSAQSSYGFAADAKTVVGEVNSTFSCDGLQYGYYADQSTECKVFHICRPVTSPRGRVKDSLMFSFFCPNRTIFSQDSRTCISEESAYPCKDAHTLYALNDVFGDEQEYVPRRTPIGLKPSPTPGVRTANVRNIRLLSEQGKPAVNFDQTSFEDSSFTLGSINDGDLPTVGVVQNSRNSESIDFNSNGERDFVLSSPKKTKPLTIRPIASEKRTFNQNLNQKIDSVTTRTPTSQTNSGIQGTKITNRGNAFVLSSPKETKPLNVASEKRTFNQNLNQKIDSVTTRTQQTNSGNERNTIHLNQRIPNVNSVRQSLAVPNNFATIEGNHELKVRVGTQSKTESLNGNISNKNLVSPNTFIGLPKPNAIVLNLQTPIIIPNSSILNTPKTSTTTIMDKTNAVNFENSETDKSDVIGVGGRISNSFNNVGSISSLNGLTPPKVHNKIRISDVKSNQQTGENIPSNSNARGNVQSSFTSAAIKHSSIDVHGNSNTGNNAQSVTHDKESIDGQHNSNRQGNIQPLINVGSSLLPPQKTNSENIRFTVDTRKNFQSISESNDENSQSSLNARQNAHSTAQTSGGHEEVYKSERNNQNVQSSSGGNVQSNLRGNVQSIVRKVKIPGRVNVQSTIGGNAHSTSRGNVQSVVRNKVKIPGRVNVQSTSQGNVQSTLRGNVHSTSGGSVQSTSRGNVQSTSGGSVQSTLGGNVHSTSGGSVQSTSSRGNVQSTSGGSVQSTSSRGNVQSTSGGSVQSTLGGNVHSTSGGSVQSTSSRGNVHSTSGGSVQSTSSRGNVQSTSGGSVQSTLGGNVHSTSGGSVQSTSSRGNVHSTSGGSVQSTSSRGNVQSTSGGSVQSTLGGNVHSTSGGSVQSTSSRGNVQSTSGGSVQSTSRGNVHSTSGGSVQSTLRGNVQSTSGGSVQSTSSRGNIQSTSRGNIHSTSGGSVQSTLGGNVQSTSRGNVQSTSGGSVQSTLGGNVQSTSRGNVQSTSGGNVQSTSRGNVQSTSGGSVQSTSRGNVQSTSGGNVQSNFRGNVQSTSEGNVQSTLGGNVQSNFRGNAQSVVRNKVKIPGRVNVQSTTRGNVQSTSGGNVQSNFRGNVQTTSRGNVQSTTRGNVQSTSGGNVQSNFRGNVQTTSRGNVQSNSGGNVQSTSRGIVQSVVRKKVKIPGRINVQSTSGGNVQSTSRGNVQSTSGGNVHFTSEGNVQSVGRKSVQIGGRGNVQFTAGGGIQSTGHKNVQFSSDTARANVQSTGRGNSHTLSGASVANEFNSDFKQNMHEKSNNINTSSQKQSVKSSHKNTFTGRGSTGAINQATFKNLVDDGHLTPEKLSQFPFLNQNFGGNATPIGFRIVKPNSKTPKKSPAANKPARGQNSFDSNVEKTRVNNENLNDKDTTKSPKTGVLNQAAFENLFKNGRVSEDKLNQIPFLNGNLGGNARQIGFKIIKANPNKNKSSSKKKQSSNYDKIGSGQSTNSRTNNLQTNSEKENNLNQDAVNVNKNIPSQLPFSINKFGGNVRQIGFKIIKNPNYKKKDVTKDTQGTSINEFENIDEKPIEGISDARRINSRRGSKNNKKIKLDSLDSRAHTQEENDRNFKNSNRKINTDTKISNEYEETITYLGPPENVRVIYPPGVDSSEIPEDERSTFKDHPGFTHTRKVNRFRSRGQSNNMKNSNLNNPKSDLIGGSKIPGFSRGELRENEKKFQGDSKLNNDKVGRGKVEEDFTKRTSNNRPGLRKTYTTINRDQTTLDTIIDIDSLDNNARNGYLPLNGQAANEQSNINSNTQSSFRGRQRTKITLSSPNPTVRTSSRNSRGRKRQQISPISVGKIRQTTSNTAKRNSERIELNSSNNLEHFINEDFDAATASLLAGIQPRGVIRNKKNFMPVGQKEENEEKIVKESLSGTDNIQQSDSYDSETNGENSNSQNSNREQRILTNTRNSNLNVAIESQVVRRRGGSTSSQGIKTNSNTHNIKRENIVEGGESIGENGSTSNAINIDNVNLDNIETKESHSGNRATNGITGIRKRVFPGRLQNPSGGINEFENIEEEAIEGISDARRISSRRGSKTNQKNKSDFSNSRATQSIRHGNPNLSISGTVGSFNTRNINGKINPDFTSTTTTTTRRPRTVITTNRITTSTTPRPVNRNRGQTKFQPSPYLDLSWVNNNNLKNQLTSFRRSKSTGSNVRHTTNRSSHVIQNQDTKKANRKVESRNNINDDNNSNIKPSSGSQNTFQDVRESPRIIVNNLQSNTRRRIRNNHVKLTANRINSRPQNPDANQLEKSSLPEKNNIAAVTDLPVDNTNPIGSQKEETTTKQLKKETIAEENSNFQNEDSDLLATIDEPATAISSQAVTKTRSEGESTEVIREVNTIASTTDKEPATVNLVRLVNNPIINNRGQNSQSRRKIIQSKKRIVKTLVNDQINPTSETVSTIKDDDFKLVDDKKSSSSTSTGTGSARRGRLHNVNIKIRNENEQNVKASKDTENSEINGSANKKQILAKNENLSINFTPKLENNKKSDISPTTDIKINRKVGYLPTVETNDGASIRKTSISNGRRSSRRRGRFPVREEVLLEEKNHKEQPIGVSDATKDISNTKESQLNIELPAIGTNENSGPQNTEANFVGNSLNTASIDQSGNNDITISSNSNGRRTSRRRGRVLINRRIQLDQNNINLIPNTDTDSEKSNLDSKNDESVNEVPVAQKNEVLKNKSNDGYLPKIVTPKPSEISEINAPQRSNRISNRGRLRVGRKRLISSKPIESEDMNLKEPVESNDEESDIKFKPTNIEVSSQRNTLRQSSHSEKSPETVVLDKVTTDGNNLVSQEELPKIISVSVVNPLNTRKSGRRRLVNSPRRIIKTHKENSISKNTEPRVRSQESRLEKTDQEEIKQSDTVKPTTETIRPRVRTQRKKLEKTDQEETEQSDIVNPTTETIRPRVRTQRRRKLEKTDQEESKQSDIVQPTIRPRIRSQERTLEKTDQDVTEQSDTVKPTTETIRPRVPTQRRRLEKTDREESEQSVTIKSTSETIRPLVRSQRRKLEKTDQETSEQSDTVKPTTETIRPRVRTQRVRLEKTNQEASEQSDIVKPTTKTIRTRVRTQRRRLEKTDLEETEQSDIVKPTTETIRPRVGTQSRKLEKTDQEANEQSDTVKPTTETIRPRVRTQRRRLVKTNQEETEQSDTVESITETIRPLVRTQSRKLEKTDQEASEQSDTVKPTTETIRPRVRTQSRRLVKTNQEETEQSDTVESITENIRPRVRTQRRRLVKTVRRPISESTSEKNEVSEVTPVESPAEIDNGKVSTQKINEPIDNQNILPKFNEVNDIEKDEDSYNDETSPVMKPKPIRKQINFEELFSFPSPNTDLKPESPEVTSEKNQIGISNTLDEIQMISETQNSRRATVRRRLVNRINVEQEVKPKLPVIEETIVIDEAEKNDVIDGLEKINDSTTKTSISTITEGYSTESSISNKDSSKDIPVTASKIVRSRSGTRTSFPIRRKGNRKLIKKVRLENDKLNEESLGNVLQTLRSVNSTVEDVGSIPGVRSGSKLRIVGTSVRKSVSSSGSSNSNSVSSDTSVGDNLDQKETLDLFEQFKDVSQDLYSSHGEESNPVKTTVIKRKLT